MLLLLRHRCFVAILIHLRKLMELKRKLLKLLRLLFVDFEQLGELSLHSFHGRQARGEVFDLVFELLCFQL